MGQASSGCCSKRTHKPEAEDDFEYDQYPFPGRKNTLWKQCRHLRGKPPGVWHIVISFPIEEQILTFNHDQEVLHEEPIKHEERHTVRKRVVAELNKKPMVNGYYEELSNWHWDPINPQNTRKLWEPDGGRHQWTSRPIRVGMRSHHLQRRKDWVFLCIFKFPEAERLEGTQAENKECIIDLFLDGLLDFVGDEMTLRTKEEKEDKELKDLKSLKGKLGSIANIAKYATDAKARNGVQLKDLNIRVKALKDGSWASNLQDTCSTLGQLADKLLEEHHKNEDSKNKEHRKEQNLDLKVETKSANDWADLDTLEELQRLEEVLQPGKPRPPDEFGINDDLWKEKEAGVNIISREVPGFTCHGPSGVIGRVFPGSRAARAGVQPGWKVIDISGRRWEWDRGENELKLEISSDTKGYILTFETPAHYEHQFEEQSSFLDMMFT